MKKQLYYFGLSGILLYLIIITNCSKNNNGNEFYPLSVGNEWHYTGAIGLVKVTNRVCSEHYDLFTINYFDSLKTHIWSEKFEQSDHVYWKSFEPNIQFVPSISFDPPILLTPFSTIPGAQKSISTFEQRVDDDSAYELLVDYAILKVENVETKAGVFSGCVKMGITISYIEKMARSYMQGTFTYWFAPNVGIVKYETPAFQGELISYKLN